MIKLKMTKLTWLIQRFGLPSLLNQTFQVVGIEQRKGDSGHR